MIPWSKPEWGDRVGLTQYQDRMVRLGDSAGRQFAGVAEVNSPDYTFHEYGVDEESIKLCDFLFFESQIGWIEEAPELEIVRVGETWQAAAAHYVRVRALAERGSADLRAEFDAHDGADARSVVMLDAGLPVGMARMVPLDRRNIRLDRVIVLPERRRRGYGLALVDACEWWAEELFCARMEVECPEALVPFFEDCIYEVCGEAADPQYVRMEKDL